MAWLLIGGGLALILGAFLPWATLSAPFVGSISKSGIDGGDGWITVALGAALVGIGVRTMTQRVTVPFVGTVLTTVIAGLVTLYELGDVSDHIEDAEYYGEGLISASIGAGLWLSLAGVIAAAVGVARSRSVARADGWRPGG